eukprot:1518580-Rhodomonas_salina.3
MVGLGERRGAFCQQLEAALVWACQHAGHVGDARCFSARSLSGARHRGHTLPRTVDLQHGCARPGIATLCAGIALCSRLHLDKLGEDA